MFRSADNNPPADINRPVPEKWFECDDRRRAAVKWQPVQGQVVRARHKVSLPPFFVLCPATFGYRSGTIFGAVQQVRDHERRLSRMWVGLLGFSFPSCYHSCSRFTGIQTKCVSQTNIARDFLSLPFHRRHTCWRVRSWRTGIKISVRQSQLEISLSKNCAQLAIKLH